MDRNETVRISRLAAFGGLTERDSNMVLMQYCMEHEKSCYDSAMFVMNVLKSKQLLTHCLNITLSFYERKFTVYKLWSAPNPLNKMGQERKLLQIF
jgi:hypothetical protein